MITILILEFSISNLLRLERLRKNLKNIVNTYKNTTLARNGPETSLDVQLGPLPHDLSADFTFTFDHKILPTISCFTNIISDEEEG